MRLERTWRGNIHTQCWSVMLSSGGPVRVKLSVPPHRNRQMNDTTGICCFRLEIRVWFVWQRFPWASAAVATENKPRFTAFGHCSREQHRTKVSGPTQTVEWIQRTASTLTALSLCCCYMTAGRQQGGGGGGTWWGWRRRQSSMEGREVTGTRRKKKLDPLKRWPWREGGGHILTVNTSVQNINTCKERSVQPAEWTTMRTRSRSGNTAALPVVSCGHYRCYRWEAEWTEGVVTVPCGSGGSSSAATTWRWGSEEEDLQPGWQHKPQPVRLKQHMSTRPPKGHF